MNEIHHENNIQNSTAFSKKSLYILKAMMHVERVSKGSNLFNEGDPADSLYFLLEGTIRLTKGTDDGKDLALFYFQSGDLFGEFDHNHFSQSTRTFSAKAMRYCEVGVIKKEDLEVALCQNSDFGIEFINWMAYMQRFMQLKLRDLMFYGKMGALASTLIRIANTFGTRQKNSISITEKITNAELASMIGATRETVNRMLNQLRSDGIISLNKGSLVILNLERLKEICHCEDCPLNICRL